MKRELNVKQNEPYLNPLHDTHHARKMKLFSLTVRRPDTTFQDESCQNPITVLYENVQYLLGVNMKFRKWSMVHVLSAKSTSIYRFLHDFILSYHIGMYLQLMHLQQSIVLLWSGNKLDQMCYFCLRIDLFRIGAWINLIKLCDLCSKPTGKVGTMKQ